MLDYDSGVGGVAPSRVWKSHFGCHKGDVQLAA
jgi:hypothetical protein